MGQVFKAKTRRIGNSIGVLIPKKITEKEEIKAGETIMVSLHGKETVKLIEEAFGMSKGAKGFIREHKDRY